MKKIQQNTRQILSPLISINYIQSFVHPTDTMHGTYPSCDFTFTCRGGAITLTHTHMRGRWLICSPQIEAFIMYIFRITLSSHENQQTITQLLFPRDIGSWTVVSAETLGRHIQIKYIIHVDCRHRTVAAAIEHVSAACNYLFPVRFIIYTYNGRAWICSVREIGEASCSSRARRLVLFYFFSKGT